jgi:hypothetical protein
MSSDSRAHAVSLEASESATGSAVARRRAERLLGGGTDGNERLTAVTAVVLIVLLAVEGVTIVTLRPLISVHLFVGLALIPPIGLKLASTGYRFARYYSGNLRYRRKGPPPMLLRAIAPAVVVSSVLVLASGVWLLLAGPRSRDTVLPIHKVSFIVWLAFTGLHILGHLRILPSALAAEYGRARPHVARGQGRAGRQLALAVALVAGIALALLLVPHFAPWQHDVGSHHHRHQ